VVDDSICSLCRLPANFVLVPPPPTSCPDDVDQVAESYCDGTLGAEETARFENHYTTCRECTTAVEEALRHFKSMKQADRKSRLTGPR
jgi:anti-sigma-K factor RskA